MADSPTPTTGSWTIHQGATFRVTVTFPGSGDMTGYSARCKLRTDYDGTVVATPTIWISDGPNREATVEIPATTTASMEDGGVSDVEAEDPDTGDVVRARRIIPYIVLPEATY